MLSLNRSTNRYFSRLRGVCIALLGVAAFVVATPLRGQLPLTRAQTQPLPTRLSDAEFWKLSTDASEQGGSFPSDNWTSNEMGFPRILNMLRAANDTGGAYLGVGPEQNFSYIAEIRPRIAFLVDIRRQSIIQHLMYKAVFELSKDRADFISLLFSKPRPVGLDTSSSIAAIWEAYWYVPTDTSGFARNLERITNHLTKTHGFALDAVDIASLRRVYDAFYQQGPKINYSGSSNGGMVVMSGATGTANGIVYTRSITGTGSIVSGTVSGVSVSGVSAPFSVSTAPTNYYAGVNFAALSASTDEFGVPRSFLATENSFRFLKELHTKNLFVPVVGDFAGPKAIRSVGQYLRDHGTTVTAFYTSNVEQYLFQNRVWTQFYGNVATLPMTSTSTFIRNGMSVCPILPFLAAVDSGRVQVYADATRCVK